VYRISNVSGRDSRPIADIRHFVGLHDIELLYKLRLAEFVKRTSTLGHPVPQSFNSSDSVNGRPRTRPYVEVLDRESQHWL